MRPILRRDELRFRREETQGCIGNRKSITVTFGQNVAFLNVAFLQTIDSDCSGCGVQKKIDVAFAHHQECCRVVQPTASKSRVVPKQQARYWSS